MRAKIDENVNDMYETVLPISQKDIDFEKLRHKNAIIEEKLRHENSVKEQKVEQETFKEGQKMLKISEKVVTLQKNNKPYKMTNEEIEIMSKTMTKTMHELEKE